MQHHQSGKENANDDGAVDDSFPEGESACKSGTGFCFEELFDFATSLLLCFRFALAICGSCETDLFDRSVGLIIDHTFVSSKRLALSVSPASAWGSGQCFTEGATYFSISAATGSMELEKEDFRARCGQTLFYDLHRLAVRAMTVCSLNHPGSVWTDAESNFYGSSGVG